MDSAYASDAAILEAALGVPAGSQRDGYLRRICGHDSARHERVRRLIVAHENAGGFLDAGRPAPAASIPPLLNTAESTQQAAPQELPGIRVGRYRLLQLIGEGGFGAVYMAEQTEPMVRRVAVKVIKLGMDTRQVIARFEAERQALALMDHANIARVLDAGATDTGRPYFAMELVKGAPITEYCDRHQLSIRARLDLFISICHAVQHAHQKGIIHRDLKPSNVLVTNGSTQPTPKVIDFGIAKAMHQRLTDRTLFTDFHQMIGTPAYMSPEQAEGGLDVDTRSDIYSLGVVLYELLAGVTPFDKNRLRSASYAELQRIIREEDPPRPSTRISSLHSAAASPPIESDEPFPASSVAAISRARQIDSRGLTRALRGDLDLIVMKCLEKDRARRYDTAAALALDIERFTAGEPVSAAPPSRAYRLRKFVRRNNRAVLASAAVAAALVTGIIVTSWAMLKALDSERRALTEAEKMDKVNRFLASLLAGVDPHQYQGVVDVFTIDARATDLIFGALPRVKELFDGTPDLEVRVRRILGEALSALGRIEAGREQLRLATRIGEERLGPDHPDTVLALGRLGRSLVIWDFTSGPIVGLPVISEANRRYERVFGPLHELTIENLAQLGTTTHIGGDFAAGERMLRDARERAGQAFGPDHLLTRRIDLRIAWIPVRDGTFKVDTERVQELIQSFERDRDVHGRAVLTLTADALTLLGEVYSHLGRLEDARRHFAEAHRRALELYGANNPLMVIFAAPLGLCLIDLGRVDEAVTLAAETANSISNSPDIFGVDRARREHAWALLCAGRFADAEALARTSIADAQSVGGPQDHFAQVELLAHTAILISAIESQGRVDEADAMMSAMIPQFEQVEKRISREDRFYCAVAHIGGRCAIRMGRFGVAAEALPVALAAAERKHGIGSARARAIIADLATLYDTWHAAEPGQGYDAQAAAWRLKHAEGGVDPQTNGQR